MITIIPSSITRDRDRDRIYYSYISNESDTIRNKYILKNDHLYTVTILIVLSNINTKQAGTYTNNLNLKCVNNHAVIDSSVSFSVQCPCFSSLCSAINFSVNRNYFCINFC